KDNQNLVKIVEATSDCNINRHGYKLPEYTINKGVTYLHLGEDRIPLQVFGKLNLSNIAGAYTVCEWLGIKQADFYEAIKDFKSSIRYLEFVASENESVVYQDFLYSPYKLRTSIHAVKEQFPGQGLVTIMELNAYDVINRSRSEEHTSELQSRENHSLPTRRSSDLDFYEAIKDFKSSIRYLEFVASENESVVYQDFLYSPYKLRTSIHAVKEQFPGQGLVTIMELNAYDVINRS